MISMQEKDTPTMDTSCSIIMPSFLPRQCSHLGAQERQSPYKNNTTQCRATTKTIHKNDKTSMGQELGARCIAHIINAIGTN